MLDKIKLFVALLLVGAGIEGYYYLHDSAAVVRLVSILVGFLLAAGVAWTSAPGKRFFGFSRDSVAEAKRVAARAVIVQVPAVSADGQWNGTEMDIRFNRWHHRLSRMWDRNTTEHIDEGLPSIEQLRGQFAGGLVQGQQHGTTWLWCMLLARLPFFGLMTGFLYLLVFKRRAHRPPYYACLITYAKPNRANGTGSALPAAENARKSP